MTNTARKFIASTLAATLFVGLSACADPDEDQNTEFSTTLPEEFVPDPGTTTTLAP